MKNLKLFKTVAVLMAGMVYSVAGINSASASDDDSTPSSHSSMSIPYTNPLTWQRIKNETGTDCKVCHVYATNIKGKNAFNAYGWDIRSYRNQGMSYYNAILAVEGKDSDGNGDNNIAEIQAGSQPGWTSLGNVGYFSAGGTIIVDAYRPMQAPLDPVVTTAKIWVEVTSMNFGTVAVGASGNQSFQIKNSGIADLWVSYNITGSSEFAVNTPPPSPFMLSPGQGGFISVGYTPVDNGSDTGALVFNSNDPLNPTISISLSGSGNTLSPSCDVSITPTSLSFGTVTVGQKKTLSVALSNISGVDCVINGHSVANSDGDFKVGAGTPVMPLVLAAGGSTAVYVDYTPSSAASDTGQLIIYSNDATAPQTAVGLSGTGQSSTVAADLDIKQLSVPDQTSLNKSFTPQIQIERKNGQGTTTHTAELVGVQNGVTVYSKQISVNFSSTGSAWFYFPSYSASKTGTIYWTAKVFDNDPDTDQYTRSTKISY